MEKMNDRKGPSREDDARKTIKNKIPAERESKTEAVYFETPNTRN
jgi:hypothetical protein